tara:strand:- start:43909 stop:44865 length:957 start_codon:yes stop_codon:yes gene_type:complete
MKNYPDVAGPDVTSTPALAGLVTLLRACHNDKVDSVLLYGSCLRSGDVYDGLLDIYVICNSYAEAYQHRLLAIANWMLPPNVFYVEMRDTEQPEDRSKTLRCKVSVISFKDFQQGCRPASFESYFWGRFAQPTRILYSSDEGVRCQVEGCLLEAARTLMVNTLPRLAEWGRLADMWAQALDLSYSTELRTERSGRAAELVQQPQEYYACIAHYHADSLGFPVDIFDERGEPSYYCDIGKIWRWQSAIVWALRRCQGKILSVTRLLKALYTFDGGLDYIAWKLERHTGEKVVIPNKVKKAPLIFMWSFFWSLYRRGLFR